MTKEFIPYEQALTLKELGFDEPCFGYYNNLGNYIEDYEKTNSDCNKPGMHGKYCTAPLYSQTFRFLRESGFDFSIFEKYKDLGKFYGGYIRKSDSEFGKSFGSNFKTYEEAEQACLNKLIEIVK